MQWKIIYIYIYVDPFLLNWDDFFSYLSNFSYLPLILFSKVVGKGQIWAKINLLKRCKAFRLIFH